MAVGSGLSYDRLLMPRSAGGLGKCRRRLSQLSSAIQSGDASSELLLVDWYVYDARRFVRNEGSENREMGDSTSSSRRIYLWFEGWGGIWMGCIVKGRESAYNSSKTGEAITLILLPFCYCPLFGFSSLQVLVFAG